MNKHGWGLRKELAFILLFVFCLLIAMVGLSQFGLTEDSSDKTSYKTLENKLTSAALEYYNDKYNSASGDVVIIKFSTFNTFTPLLIHKVVYISSLFGPMKIRCIFLYLP